MSRRQESPKVTVEIAISTFKLVVKKIYQKYNLELPSEIYLADSRAEASIGIGRSYANSDIDILVEEPITHKISLEQLEEQIRDALGESGVDFNFAKKEDLKACNAYGRYCSRVANFRW